jgi:DNA-binding NtrC family response regulator
MANYRWPGNVRELENVVERIAILSDGDVIEPANLPEYITEEAGVPQAFALADLTLPSSGVNFNELVDTYESKLISSALSQTNGNKKAAAKLLGLNRTTLVEKIKKKGLESKIEVLVVGDDEGEKVERGCN